MTERETAERRIQSWIDGYLRAWASNEPDDIRALFTDDAEYRTEPWVPPTVGSDAIVAQWLERSDEPGTFSFRAEIAGIDGARGFVQGVTNYSSGTVYSNLWVIDLAEDGRARSFTEWWMDQSDKS
jgi:hypothetical protein